MEEKRSHRPHAICAICVTLNHEALVDEVRHARSRKCATEEQANDIGHHLQDNHPPRVVGFQPGLLSLLRVSHDVLNLLFCKFDFHTR